MGENIHNIYKKGAIKHIEIKVTCLIDKTAKNGVNKTNYKIYKNDIY